MAKTRVDVQNFAFPVLATRGIVAFPKSVTHLNVVRSRSVAAIEQAIATNKLLFVIAQRDVTVANPNKEDLYDVGTVVEIKQFQRYANDEIRITVVGLFKAKIMQFHQDLEFNTAIVKRLPERTCIHQPSEQLEGLLYAIKHKFNQYIDIIKQPHPDLLNAVENETNPFMIYTVIATILPIKYSKKQQMLEEQDLYKRLQLLLQATVEEAFLADMEREFIEQAEQRIDQNQREYFLREQYKLITEELGYEEKGIAVEQKYIEKIQSIQNISNSSREKLLEEARRLSHMPDSSHESYVITNYLDTVLRLPWDDKTEEIIDLNQAQKILDRDHYGLKKVKERILENLAVRIFNPDLKGQIICLVGPPGVGKTSIAHSMADAIGRNFTRVSLGGINDESEIRGHRKTYIGAMPGRIIHSIIQSKSRNPLVLLDEIDKMGASFKGDPASAMLEVLDGEQNHTFVDHYIEIPFDLSECLFITTANTLSTIPAPLLDRMEVIELSSYTAEEKFHIAKEYLLPKQLKKHGLSSAYVKFSDVALRQLIDFYTHEAGVRSLERNIASLLRKAAKQIASKESASVSFTKNNLEKFLGPKKYIHTKADSVDQIGCVNGLAWTSVGGELMQIEAAVMDGKGNVQLTGCLGDIMKESANAAISYVRSVSAEYGIPLDFYHKKDIHIHVPEGAVPKDGPSAGVALVTVLISALAGLPIRHDVAMTGEITLRGRDLPIGGLKEKAIAAYKSGMSTVLIPYENLRDLEEIDSDVRKSLNFIPCKTVKDVLKSALVFSGKSKETSQKQKKHSLKHNHSSSAGMGMIG